MALLIPAPASASLDLARKNACINCHAAERKLVGPSYREVMRRYEGQSDAVEQLTQRIRAGGAGRWGPVPMPAQPRLSEADARELAVWVLQGGR
jgi:cytochrome c